MSRQFGPRRLLAGIVALAAVATVVIVISRDGADGPAEGPAPRGAQRGAAYAAPSGSGLACTDSAPCSLKNALRHGAGTVYLLGGQYPPQTIGQVTSRAVTVTPAPGVTDALLGLVTTAARDVTWLHVTGNDQFKVAPYADDNTFDHFTLAGPKVQFQIRAAGTTVRNSLIEGGAIRDGIQIGATSSTVRSRDTTIVDTTVRNFTAGNFGQQHPDCLQLYDTERVTVTRVNFYNCHNSAIITSAGQKLGVDDVKITSSFLQGCVPSRQPCGSGASVDLRSSASNVIADHDTFGYGALRLPARSDVVVTHAIVRYLGTCTGTLTDSLVTAYNTNVCHTLPGTGNKLGTAAFVDIDAGNMHLAGPATSAASGSGTDIDGQRFAATQGYGADQP